MSVLQWDTLQLHVTVRPVLIVLSSLQGMCMLDMEFRHCRNFLNEGTVQQVHM